MNKIKLDKIRLEEFQLIEGKPHGGLWLGKCVIISGVECSRFTEMEIFDKYGPPLIDSLPKHLEIRDHSLIFKPPHFFLNGTLAVKYFVWGRAYKVLKLLKNMKKKKQKIFKKAYQNGKRKKIKVVY